MRETFPVETLEPNWLLLGAAASDGRAVAPTKLLQQTPEKSLSLFLHACVLLIIQL